MSHYQAVPVLWGPDRNPDGPPDTPDVPDTPSSPLYEFKRTTTHWIQSQYIVRWLRSRSQRSVYYTSVFGLTFATVVYLTLGAALREEAVVSVGVSASGLAPLGALHPEAYHEATGLRTVEFSRFEPENWSQWGAYVHGNLSVHQYHPPFQRFQFEISADPFLHIGTTAPGRGVCSDLPPLERASLEQAFSNPNAPFDAYLGAVVLPESALAGLNSWHGAQAAVTATWRRGSRDVLCGYVISVTPSPSRSTAAQAYGHSGKIYAEQVPGFAPDSIRWTAQGLQGYFSKAEYRPVPWTETFDHAVVRVYAAMLPLMDPDLYHLEAVLEYQHYQWNPARLEQTRYEPLAIPITTVSGRGRAQMIGKGLVVSALDLHVPGTPLTMKAYRRLPLCTGGDHYGRWVPLRQLVLDVDTYLRDRRRQIDEFRFPLIKDQRTWIPYDCRYRHYTYDELTNDCLAPHYPTIHSYGDSNMRRTWKTMTTGGAWCNTFYSPESHECNCEDQGLPSELIPGPPGDYYLMHMAGMSKVKTYFSWWMGLIDRGMSFRVELNPQLLRERLVNNGMPSAPNVTIMGLGNWDAAFSMLDDVTRDAPELARLVIENYVNLWDLNDPHSQSQHLIYRPPQAFCCRAGAEGRKLSHLRTTFVDLLLRAHLVPLGFQVWDVHMLGDRRGQPILGDCDSNHATRPEIDMEVTILNNMLCNEHVFTDSR